MAQPKALIPPPAAPASSTSPGENRARQAQHEAVSALQQAPIAGARRYPDRLTLVAGTDLKVMHGLGRELVGWLATRQSGAGSVWEVSADRDALVLQTSLDMEVDLWLW